MKHLRNLLILLPITLICLSCSKAPEMVKIEGFTQGTTYHITYAPTGTTAPAEIENAITGELQRIDEVFSNYRDDSLIELFNAQHTTDLVEVDAELVALIEEARKINHASQGCYDLTIKPLFDLWGFKKDVFTPPGAEQLAQTLSAIGMGKLETPDYQHLRKQIPELRVDVSSIGQGYTVRQLANILEKNGIVSYMVEIGGELQVSGLKPDANPWRIALEKPLPNERKLHKIAEFNHGKTMAMMTSGTYRHYFDSEGKRYSHILDARTGAPVTHSTVSVTVLHPNATLADAWSTALLCLGSKAGLPIAEEQHIAALFIDEDSGRLVEYPSNALPQVTDVSFQQP